MDENKLTSVHIDKYLYKQFKIKAIEQDVSLKELVTKALHEYVSSSNENIQLPKSGSI